VLGRWSLRSPKLLISAMLLLCARLARPVGISDSGATSNLLGVVLGRCGSPCDAKSSKANMARFVETNRPPVVSARRYCATRSAIGAHMRAQAGVREQVLDLGRQFQKFRPFLGAENGPAHRGAISNGILAAFAQGRQDGSAQLQAENRRSSRKRAFADLL